MKSPLVAGPAGRWLGVIIPILVLAACARGPAPDTALPISEITARGPTVVDITGTSVTIEFISTVPVVCAVAYGTSTDYGAIATDTAMGGTGHTEHLVTLGGIEPATTYHFRQLASAPNGRTYRSADLTFTTAQPSPRPMNLASTAQGARVVGVSSNFGNTDNDGPFGATRALDGNPATEWASHGDGDMAWLEVDMGNSHPLSSIGFWSREMPDGTSRVKRFRVLAETGQVLGPFELPDARQLYTFPVNVTARRLRFEVLESTGGNTGARELAAY